MQENYPNIFIHYKPAELHQGKIWYINYYVINPVTGTLKEKRIKWNKIKSKTERKKAAKKLIVEINNKLAKGWNPFLQEDAPKSFTPIITGLDLFLTSKKKELRADSIRSYKSIIEVLKTWCINSGNEETLLINFNKITVYSFLSYLENKDISNRTYNNYLKSYRTVFSWLKTNLYISHNPFLSVATKKNQKKSRIIIPAEKRNDIKTSLLEDGEIEFLAICLLVFGSLIRPKEISYLKKEHFNFNNQTITLSHEFTKNGNMRISTIPNYNMQILQICVSNAGKGQFIFGKKLKPSNLREDSRVYAKHWDKLRQKLKMPLEMKLYSLRDSGIVELLSNGISPHEVMRLADHQDLTTTTTYLPYANPTGSDIIKNKSTGF